MTGPPWWPAARRACYPAPGGQEVGIRPVLALPTWRPHLMPPPIVTRSMSVSAVPLGVSRLLASGADPARVSALPRLSAGAVRTLRGPWTLRALGTTTPSPMMSWTTCTRGPAPAVSTPFLLPAVRPAGDLGLPPVPTQGCDAGEPLQLTAVVVWGRGGQAGVSCTSSRALRPPSPGLPAQASQRPTSVCVSV